MRKVDLECLYELCIIFHCPDILLSPKSDIMSKDVEVMHVWDQERLLVAAFNLMANIIDETLDFKID